MTSMPRDLSLSPTPTPRSTSTSSSTSTIPSVLIPGSDEELGQELTRLAGHINAAQHRFLKLLAALIQRNAWGGDSGMKTPAHWLNYYCGIDLGAAREKVRVAKALGGLPLIDQAFATGAISYSKVRAMTRSATTENEAYLLNIARHGTAQHMETLVRQHQRAERLNSNERAKRQHRERSLSVYYDEDGMLVIQGRFAPEEGAVVFKALEAACDAIEVEGRQEANERVKEIEQKREMADARVIRQRRGLGQKERSKGKLLEEDERQQKSSGRKNDKDNANGKEMAQELEQGEELGQNKNLDQTKDQTKEQTKDLARTSSLAQHQEDIELRTDDKTFLQKRPQEHMEFESRVAEESSVEGESGRTGESGESNDPDYSVESGEVEAEIPTFPQKRADAVLRMAEHFLATHQQGVRGLANGDKYQVILHLQAGASHDELLAGDYFNSHFNSHLDNGPPLAPDTVRRIACDAALVALAEDADGNILNVGRKSRTVPASIRRALNVRDRGCRYPGCCHSRHVDAHHIEHWCDGGETSLENLVLLCGYHHRLLHEGAYSIEKLAGDELRFRDSGGRGISRALYPQFPEHSERESTDMPMSDKTVLELQHESMGLAIDSRTAVTRWRGESIDYELAVAACLSAACKCVN